MDLLKEFQLHFNNNKKKLLLAISGGIDSVVLCDLLHKAGADFVLAHCNFQLRGEESERDEQFVRKLATLYGKTLFVQRFHTSTYAEENKLSIQVAARQLRYDWFRQLIKKEHVADMLVTAHHADDNIETVIMNFFRGTGLNGLKGMQNDNYIYRPLLPFRKRDMLAYAEALKLPHVEDSSNASVKYTRNFFRNELLPAIKNVFPTVEENILKNIERLNEVAQVYEEAVNEQKEKLIEKKGDEAHIPILKLRKKKSFKTILWEILKDKNFTAHQVNEVIKLMDADNGSYISSSTHRIIKNRKWLIVTNVNDETLQDNIVIDEPTKDKQRIAGRLMTERLDLANLNIPATPAVACFDLDEITYPLILRKWKQGDYFYPLGMRKKKKVSKFLIDQKLSLPQKENVWVLEMNKKIMWIVGYRIDDRFKITPSTKRAIKMTSLQ